MLGNACTMCAGTVADRSHNCWTVSASVPHSGHCALNHSHLNSKLIIIPREGTGLAHLTVHTTSRDVPSSHLLHRYLVGSTDGPFPLSLYQLSFSPLFSAIPQLIMPLHVSNAHLYILGTYHAIRKLEEILCSRNDLQLTILLPWTAISGHHMHVTMCAISTFNQHIMYLRTTQRPWGNKKPAINITVCGTWEVRKYTCISPH